MLSNLRHALKQIVPAADAERIAHRARRDDRRAVAPRDAVLAARDRQPHGARDGERLRRRRDRADAAAKPAARTHGAAARRATRVRNYIGGRYVDAASGKTFADDQPGDRRDARRGRDRRRGGGRARRRGGEARPGRVGGDDRRRARPRPERAADILRARNAELARLETLDTGKPIQETSAVDVISGADCLDYFAGLAAALAGEHVDLGPSAFGYTRREPLGVVAGIGAWNYPIQIACWKAAPALACGNAMIFKPAELTPLTAPKLAEIFTEAGLPDGVFNVVQGFAETGRLLTRHPAIAKVSLTGEVGTGKAVMADAAPTLKHVTLELGGKSPLIVFDDADLDDAVSGALLANFYSAGEVCSNGTRVFVHDSVKAPFLDKLVAAGRAHGHRRSARSEDAGRRAHLGGAHEEGARLHRARARRKARSFSSAASGSKPGALGAGCFVEPTVFDGCSDDMAIVREEIFGPVMTVLSFAEEDEVIARANDTEYGLAAGVFTRDLARGHRVIARLRSRHLLDQPLQRDADRTALRRRQALRPRPRERQGGDRALHPAEERLRRRSRRSRRRTEPRA